MIVLDEQLLDPELARAIALRTRSRVRRITDLRPHTVIKDDAVPVLLRTVRRPTFVTLNWTDFWECVKADTHFCVVCFALPRERRFEIPPLLRRLLSLPEFRTTSARMGKVILVGHTHIRYYQSGQDVIQAVDWPK